MQVSIWEPQLVPRIDPDGSLTDHSTEALDSDDDCAHEPEQSSLSVVSFRLLIGFFSAILFNRLVYFALNYPGYEKFCDFLCHSTWADPILIFSTGIFTHKIISYLDALNHIYLIV